ncbi:MAG: hypothetical protein EAZ97_01905 [Bacteroidetes bacterium]|nr:MAG: hypothetical protein EAZ97_01905 [Bacteroidota bacterium]
MKISVLVFLFSFSAFAAQKPQKLDSLQSDSLKRVVLVNQQNTLSEKKLTWKEKFILRKVNKKLEKTRHGGGDAAYGAALFALMVGLGIFVLLLIVGAVISLLLKVAWLAILLGAVALLTVVWFFAIFG